MLSQLRVLEAGGSHSVSDSPVVACFAVSSIFGPPCFLALQLLSKDKDQSLITLDWVMLSSLKNTHWDDMAEAVPAFFTSIFMGVQLFNHKWDYVLIPYTVTKLVKGEAKEAPLVHDLDFRCFIYPELTAEVAFAIRMEG